MKPSPIPEILADLQAGKMIILVDDPDRENEGDLAMLAEKVTPEAINFMVTEARGLVCAPMSEELCDHFELEMQTARTTNRMGTAFTVSVEAAQGVTTGISAADRARTISVLADPDAKPGDLAMPGHTFPLRAKKGGTLVRGGQTEGMVDLAKMCGAHPVGVICEIMNADGSMARMPELEVFAKKHDLKICTIADIIAWRRRNERLIEPVELDLPMPTAHGEFRAHLFRSILDGREHVALTRGTPGPDQLDPTANTGRRAPIDEVVPVRVHSECLTGDAFGSMRCDCGPQLALAMQTLAREERGVLVYMRQEGRGIGLANKLRAYRLQDEGLDTVEANQALGFAPDLREYGIGAQILYFLGVRRMAILTNNPKKIAGLNGFGLELVEQRPLTSEPTPHNERYLETKRDKLGHML